MHVAGCLAESGLRTKSWGVLVVDKLKLLPPEPMQKHWYRFANSDFKALQCVPLELAGLNGNPKKVVTNKGTHLSASELWS